MSSIGTYNTTTSTKASPPSYLSLSPLPTPTLQQQQQRSPWLSPVPYLLGGIAVMLGMIAFALLILACSYCKCSDRLDGENGDQERDLESGDSAEKAVKVYEEKILVIMAGDDKPTFLATPVPSRRTSVYDKNDEEGKEERTESSSQKEEEEEEEEYGNNHPQTERH